MAILILSDAGETTAVITTGGTIGSAFGAGVTTLNHESQLLKEQIAEIASRGNFKLRIFAPFSIFSEDIFPPTWGRIMRQIATCIRLGHKKIVVAHGTDTMAYSAMAASIYFGRMLGVKIVFTGAFYPPSAPKSDAAPNIEAALQAANTDDLPSGVYVAFRREENRIDIMRAQDVTPMAPDKTYFDALYGDTAGYYSTIGQEMRLIQPEGPLLNVDGPPPLIRQFFKLPYKIILQDCYPGMSLTNLNLDFDPEKANLVVLRAYHSGTMPALELRKELVTLKKKHSRTKVVLAMHPYRFVTSPYETTARLAEDGLLTVYKDILPHQLYTLAVCETSKGKSLYSVLETLEPWRFGGPPLDLRPPSLEKIIPTGNVRNRDIALADVLDLCGDAHKRGDWKAADAIFLGQLEELMRGAHEEVKRRMKAEGRWFLNSPHSPKR